MVLGVIFFAHVFVFTHTHKKTREQRKKIIFKRDIFFYLGYTKVFETRILETLNFEDEIL